MEEKLKKILFIKANSALESYQASVGAAAHSPEAKRRHERFCAIWEIVEAAGLEDEYQRWKEG